MRLPRLGWEWTRPNDFETPDQRPLKDSFQTLNKSLTFPHFRAQITGGQATGAMAPKNLTVVSDPFTLMGVANRIQVPRSTNDWWFIGYVNCLVTAFVGLGSIGFLPNGVTDTTLLYTSYTPGGIAVRLAGMMQFPVTKNDYIQVGVSSQAASTTATTAESRISGYFMPMT